MPYEFNPPLVSLIIVIRREFSQLKELIARLPPARQIIWVDGQSNDGSIEYLTEHVMPNWQIIESRPGRAHQMNEGAQLATGEYLFFLHADSKISEAAWTEALSVLTRERPIGGAFMFSFDSEVSSRVAAFVGAIARWRARTLNLVYGDQCIFVRADVFKSMGGYQDQPILEDLDLWMRLNQLGNPRLLNARIQTSARRYQSKGWLNTIVRHFLIIVGYRLGVSLHRLTLLR